MHGASGVRFRFSCVAWVGDDAPFVCSHVGASDACGASGTVDDLEDSSAGTDGAFVTDFFLWLCFRARGLGLSTGVSLPADSDIFADAEAWVCATVWREREKALHGVLCVYLCALFVVGFYCAWRALRDSATPLRKDEFRSHASAYRWMSHSGTLYAQTCAALTTAIRTHESAYFFSRAHSPWCRCRRPGHHRRNGVH